MKKFNKIIMVIAMIAFAIPAMAAMSTSNVRKNTRFLTDRMAYELNLSQNQYDDVYEVNYDFINNVRYIMNDVARGDSYAVDKYYDFLDIRNDDLRWILSSSQYGKFMEIEYFFRPIYTQNRKWAFRIYNVYTNINVFYFGKPYHYSSYCGGHYRTHHNNISFYKGRWNSRYNFKDRYHKYNGIRDDRRYDSHRKNDFGINARPNTDRRPVINSRPDNDRRPSSNVRPSTNDRRPSRTENNRVDRNESKDRKSSETKIRDNSSRSNSSRNNDKSSENNNQGARRR